MKKAIISNTIVVGVHDTATMVDGQAITPTLHYAGDTLQIVDVDFDATGWSYVEGVFVPPPPTRDQLKARRAADVAAITVTTTSGNTFDGDETSQERMARAILVMQATATPSTMWVLHDNTPATVTAVELVEALALSGAAQSALWVLA